MDIYKEIFTNKKKDIINIKERKNSNYNYENSYSNRISDITLMAFRFIDEAKGYEVELMNINHKTFTFFEFYKYYFSSPEIASYFYNIRNPKYVMGKFVKKNIRDIKYFFKYKIIELDKNILLKYIYKLKQMDENSKKKYFIGILIQNEIINKEPIKSYNDFISSGLEKYFIENKLIDNIELLNFSILGILILTVSKHNYIYYTEEINKIIQNLMYMTRKFAEIILSISLRVFSREKEKNISIYKIFCHL